MNNDGFWVDGRAQSLGRIGTGLLVKVLRPVPLGLNQTCCHQQYADPRPVSPVADVFTQDVYNITTMDANGRGPGELNQEPHVDRD